jgi:curved DNA-binding protein CbpA
MRFFTVTDSTTPEELRQKYKRLCKRHHPDKGGSNDTQAQINDEYKQALQQLLEIAESKGEKTKAKQLLHILETHVLKMCAEMKVPLIELYVPKEFQGLAFEVAKLIENRIG